MASREARNGRVLVAGLMVYGSVFLLHTAYSILPWVLDQTFGTDISSAVSGVTWSTWTSASNSTIVDSTASAFSLQAASPILLGAVALMLIAVAFLMSRAQCEIGGFGKGG